MTIKESALRWWAAQAQKNTFVVLSSESPDRRQREYLIKEKFLFNAVKGYWILKKPEDSIEDVFPLVYWQFIEKILIRLGSCSIWGKSALSLLSGDQNAQQNLSVKTKKKTNRKLSLPLGFEISLIHEADFDKRLAKKFEITGCKVSVDIPEKVLIDINKTKGPEVQNFVAGTDFDLKKLDILYARNPKPIVFKRLIGIAKNVGRMDLAAGLERIIETRTHYQVGRKEKIEFDPLTKKPSAIRPPWVIRQEQQVKKFENVLEKQLGTTIRNLKKHTLDTLLARAKEHKKYDTYHSTTLEGYQITAEEVDTLLSGIAPKEIQEQDEAYVEKIKNRMAILGYSAAFDFITEKAQTDFNRPNVSQKLIKDTYYHLFKPSADAEIVDAWELGEYRNIAAFIKGTRYVPPSHEKLPDLMTSFELVMKNIKNPVIKVILAQYSFVTIHPYIDGNGRTARLLMNYLLLTAGYPWITIRADQRVEYFEALKKGQVDDDILPFGKFIVDMIHGAHDLLE